MMIHESIPSTSKACIFGDTDKYLRNNYINNFKKGNIKYLINIQVLTTGFDAPNITTMALMRPTASYSLFRQIVGRGMRLHPDKKTCLLLDFTDNIARFNNEKNLSNLITGINPRQNTTDIKKTKENKKIICPSCQHENSLKNDRCINIMKHGWFCGSLLEPKNCTICSKPNPRSSIHCNHCNSSILNVIQCNYCRNETPDSAPFCISCGFSSIDSFQEIRERYNNNLGWNDAEIHRIAVDFDSLKLFSNYSIGYQLTINGKQKKFFTASDTVQFINMLSPVLDKIGILRKCRIAIIRDDSSIVIEKILHTFAQRIKEHCKYIYYSLQHDLHTEEVMPNILSIDYL